MGLFFLGPTLSGVNTGNWRGHGIEISLPASAPRIHAARGSTGNQAVIRRAHVSPWQCYRKSTGIQNASYAVECLRHSVVRDNVIVRVWTPGMNEYLWFLVLWLSGKSQAFKISCTLSRNLNLRLMYKCIIRYKVFLSFPGCLLLFKHLP